MAWPHHRRLDRPVENRRGQRPLHLPQRVHGAHLQRAIRQERGDLLDVLPGLEIGQRPQGAAPDHVLLVLQSAGDGLDVLGTSDVAGVETQAVHTGLHRGECHLVLVVDVGHDRHRRPRHDPGEPFGGLRLVAGASDDVGAGCLECRGGFLLGFDGKFLGMAPAVDDRGGQAGILGTPAVRASSLALNMGNFVELMERYKLVYSFYDANEALKQAVEFLENDNIKTDWQCRKEKLLADKIDVTRYVIDLIEHNNIT